MRSGCASRRSIFFREGITIFSIIAEIVMEELKKRKIGGEIVDYDRATIFPIIPGIELLYFNKDCPEQKVGTKSVLKTMPSTIILQKSSSSDFCIIYQVGKHLPVSFIRYGYDTVFLINTDLICKYDMQAFPEIWNYVQEMGDKLQLEKQFCVVKLSSEMSEIYRELQQIPLPPTMFRFYMRLKVFEMLLQLSTVNWYSKQVHFYPYTEYDE